MKLDDDYFLISRSRASDEIGIAALVFALGFHILQLINCKNATHQIGTASFAPN
jgi:hypothetical protein